MPVWVQNVACSLAGLRMRRERYGELFWKTFEQLLKTEWDDLETQSEGQNRQLREIIQHSYRTVPYYTRVFDERGLKPSDIKTAADLEKLPILMKSTVQTTFADLQSRGWPEDRKVFGRTGGTTGTALSLVADRDTVPWQWATWWRHRHRFGVKVNEPFIVFAGRSVVPLTSMQPPFWRRNLPMHQTYVSIHHMTQPNMRPLVKYLQTRKVALYSGYPSALYTLATHLLDTGAQLPNPPRIVATGAETLLPHQRRTIEAALKTVVTDQYGASEHCGNISECEYHSYHVDMEFGVVELLPIPGLPSTLRRIICTGLRNPAMPLIRYDTGDIATIRETPCPCGRAAPMIERIDGRIESYIITPDGRRLGRLDFLFKDTHEILEAQLVQETEDSVLVKLVRGTGYTVKDEASLIADMRSYLGAVIKIQVEHVSEIPREANGKFRQIVSRVFKDRYASSYSPPARTEGEVRN